MSGKKSRKSRKKNNRTILIIEAILLVLVVGVALFFVNENKDEGKKENTEEQAQTESEESKKAEIEFPYLLEDERIEVNSMFQFTGFNPDCNWMEGENIAALEFTNKSGEYLKTISFHVVLHSGTKIEFKAEEIPAEATVYAFSTENISYDEENDGCESIASEAEFIEEAELMEDELEITVSGVDIAVTNISDAAKDNLELKCHTVFEGVLFGGSAYVYSVEALSAGETVTVIAEDCYLGDALVTSISKGN